MMKKIRWNYVMTFIFILHTALGKKSCDSSTTVTNQCPSTEMCVSIKNDSVHGYCECLPDFVRVNDTCKNVTKSDNTTPKSSSLVDQESGNGHVIAGVLIPIFLVVVIIGVYLSHKYNILVYIKFYQRNNNNYDEVMIGQDLEDDDPPLR